MKAKEPVFAGTSPKAGVDTRGLLKRDHIAIQAMPQLISGCMGFCPSTNPYDMNKSNAEAMSKIAYLIADAMIAESEKNNG